MDTNIITSPTSTLSQPDHDDIVELKVLMKTVIDKLTAMELQIKQLALDQATAQAALETRFNSQHSGLDNRLRKLEDYAVQYVPKATEFTSEIKVLQSDIEILKTDKSEVLGGWRASLFILGSVGGVLSAIWIAVNLLLFHVSITGR